MMRKISPLLSHLWTVVVLVLATASATVGLKGFLLPNDFLDGGVTGLAILLSATTGMSLSLLIMGLSVPFIVLAFRALNTWIALRSIATITGLSIALLLVPEFQLTDDKLLISVFGGLFLGIGIGLAIRAGAVLDGSEVLGIYIHDRFGVSIASVILTINVIIFAAAAAILSVEIAMYGIVTYLVTAQVTDRVIVGFEDYIGLQVSSDQYASIKADIIDEIGVGVSLLRVDAGYGRGGLTYERPLLQTVVNRLYIKRAYRIIQRHDVNAFVIEFDVNAVQGGRKPEPLRKNVF
jgi:uncharacterized membrane-anchored protein YitT (DUF2179 family)